MDISWAPDNEPAMTVLLLPSRHSSGSFFNHFSGEFLKRSKLWWALFSVGWRSYNSTVKITWERGEGKGVRGLEPACLGRTMSLHPQISYQTQDSGDTLGTRYSRMTPLPCLTRSAVEGDDFSCEVLGWGGGDTEKEFQAPPGLSHRRKNHGFQ